MTIITETPPIGIDRPRSNFVNSEFAVKIWQHGYNVLHETSIICPCKSKSTMQQSNCRNCGGSGWIFLNPKQTRMVIHSMNNSTKYQQWSQENAGTVSITAVEEEKLGFMDRITVLDGLAIFWEVLFLKEVFDSEPSLSHSESHSDSKSKSSSQSYTGFHEHFYYFNTIYPIKSILYLAVFIGSQNALIPLVYGKDFTYKGNKIHFITAEHYINPAQGVEDVSVAIRYNYAPTYHVLDIPRETMQAGTQFGVNDTEVIENMPVHAIGRRAHYQLDAQNYDATRILSNDTTLTEADFNPPSTNC